MQFRGLLASHEDLVRKRSAPDKKYDAEFKVVFDAIRQLTGTCLVQCLMLQVSRCGGEEARCLWLPRLEASS